jgi:hypothetical protein
MTEYSKVQEKTGYAIRHVTDGFKHRYGISKEFTEASIFYKTKRGADNWLINNVPSLDRSEWQVVQVRITTGLVTKPFLKATVIDDSWA